MRQFLYNAQTDGQYLQFSWCGCCVALNINTVLSLYVDLFICNSFCLQKCLMKSLTLMNYEGIKDYESLMQMCQRIN